MAKKQSDKIKRQKKQYKKLLMM